MLPNHPVWHWAQALLVPVCAFYGNSGAKLEKIIVWKYNEKVYVLVNGGAFYGW
jgi:hypothetical protein